MVNELTRASPFKETLKINYFWGFFGSLPIIEISTGKILNHKLCLRSVHSPPSTLTYAPSLIPRLMRRLGGEGYEARVTNKAKKPVKNQLKLYF